MDKSLRTAVTELARPAIRAEAFLSVVCFVDTSSVVGARMFAARYITWNICSYFPDSVFFIVL